MLMVWCGSATVLEMTRLTDGELKKKIQRIRFKKEGVGGPFVSIFDVFYKIDEAKKDYLKLFNIKPNEHKKIAKLSDERNEWFKTYFVGESDD